MKVITAIGNPEINERLKNFSEYEVIGRDIQYPEGILEILEIRKDIEKIIISNNLPEEISFYSLINKIFEIQENIEIIVFLKEKDEDVERFLNSKKIYKIYYLNNVDAFFENLNFNTNYINEVSRNIEDFKRLILESQKNIKIKGSEKIEIKEKNVSKIILISGNGGAGKSITSILISKKIKSSKKVLLVEFENSISTILGIYGRLDNKEVEVEKNLFLLKINNEKSEFNILSIIRRIREIYDYIIIDFSKEIDKNTQKYLFEIAEKIILITEANLLEISKANLLFEVYKNDYKINLNKFGILFNKVNLYSLKSEVLKDIYSEINIVGSIKYNEKYNYMINKNSINIDKELENIVKNII